MNKYILKHANGGYFVQGRGFVGAKAAATQLTDEVASNLLQSAAAFGLEASSEEVANRSFGVVYIRRKDVTAEGGVAKQPANRALNEVDPSKRRFGTMEEAITHGSRFHVRRAKKGDAPGSAGHRGFYVVETTDPVNAAVNPDTGLTNSI